MSWYKTAKKESEESKEDGKEYAICTDSIGGKEGTNERSKWDEDAKERYDRCLDHVREDD